MAEWSSVVVVVVVEAKSLALVCTKDQNRFCFSIWNQNKKIFFSKSPNEKEKKKEKKPIKKKRKKETELKTKTEHLSGH